MDFAIKIRENQLSEQYCNLTRKLDPKRIEKLGFSAQRPHLTVIGEDGI
jgi:hypothetical protein